MKVYGENKDKPKNVPYIKINKNILLINKLRDLLIEVELVSIRYSQEDEIKNLRSILLEWLQELEEG